jgi:hypothetical protein
MKFEVKKSVKAMAKAGVLAGSLLGLSMLSQSANAAQGQTKVNVSFPPLIILYYYDQIDLDLTATDLATAAAIGTCTASEPGVACAIAAPAAPLALTPGAGTITAAGTIATDAPALGPSDTTIAFDITGAWAVRALGSSALTASVTDAGASTDFSNVGTDLTSVTPSMTLTAGSNVGNITFDIDLAAITDPTLATDDVLIDITTGP